MKKYFVIGNPINHSLSPKLHNYWLKQKNIDAIYDKKKIEEKNLQTMISEVKEKKINGINVTVPFKKAVIPYLDNLSPEAEQTQSVNTIILSNDNLVGHNTDTFGFDKAIKNLNFDLQDKKIFILGAGGVVPSIIFALSKTNVSKIIVSNRTKKKADKLKNYGAKVCNSLKEVVSDQDLIITMLSDDKAIKKIYFNSEFLKNLKVGSTVIDMSSANPKTAINLSKLLKKYKVNFLDAPVSGGTNGAENAELAIMVGGEKKVFSKNLNILKKLGNPVLVGKNSAGQIAKLANQIIVGITIGSVSEAIKLSQKNNVNPINILNALKGGWADSKVLQTHGLRMIKNDFKPRGKNFSQLKDMNNILDCAKNKKLELPLSKIVKKMYNKLVKKGLGNYDHSSLYKSYK